MLLNQIKRQCNARDQRAEVVLNTGDTAWVLASTALVLLMTPGLALFYGGMVRAKSVLNMMLMSMVTIGIVSVLWVIYGFKLAFGYEANSQWYGEISLSGLGSAVNELTNNYGGRSREFYRECCWQFIYSRYCYQRC